VRGLVYNIAHLNLNTVEIDVIEVKKALVGVSCLLVTTPNDVTGFNQLSYVCMNEHL
jgi:hypothetical protein